MTEAAHYRYCLVYRPAGIGCVPRLPYSIEDRPPPGAAHHETARHGILVVQRELSLDEVRSFELQPVIEEGAAMRALAERAAAEELASHASEYLELSAEDPMSYRSAVLSALERLDAGVRYSLESVDCFERLVTHSLQQRACETAGRVDQ